MASPGSYPAFDQARCREQDRYRPLDAAPTRLWLPVPDPRSGASPRSSARLDALLSRFERASFRLVHEVRHRVGALRDEAPAYRRIDAVAIWLASSFVTAVVLLAALAVLG